MQQISNENRPTESGGNHSGKGNRLTKRDVIGGIVLAIFVVGALSGYYAYNHISKDSVRMQFWVSFMFSFAAFVVLLVQSVIYAQQARFMREQSQAMREGLTRTDNVIEKMGVQLEEMRLQSTTMRRQAIAAVSEARSTRESLKIAQTAIDAAEKSAIYANRAYVVAKVRGVTNVSCQFTLWIQNLGNTPANNVRVFYAYGVREEPPHTETPENLAVYDSGFTETESLGLIASDGSHQTIMTPRVELSDKGDYERLNSEKLKLYCWGRIHYEDIFRRKWHTDFCFEAWKSLRGANPCKHGNEAY